MASDQRIVLISYSRVDSDFAYRLRADLEASGFTIWIDTAKLENQGGQEWLRLIQDAVDACHAMIVIVSPDSIQSRYVHMEYHRAQTLSKLVIPVHYRTVTSAPIDLELDQWIDFRSGQGVSEPYQVGLTNLIRSLMRAPTPPKYPDLPSTPGTGPLTMGDGANIPEFRPVSPPPPPPPQALTTLMTAAYDARGKADLAGEQYYIQQIIAQDPSFAGGTFVQRYEEVTHQIESQRVERLRALARSAAVEKQWRRAFGAWQALLDIRPGDSEAQAGERSTRIERAKEALRDGEVDEAVGIWQALLRSAPADQVAQNGLHAALRTRADDAWRKANWTRAAESWETLRSHFPVDEEAQTHLDAIEQNQRGDLYYQSAQRSLTVGNIEGARVALADLYQIAPNYGDPQGIAPKVGVLVPKPSFHRQLSAPASQMGYPAPYSIPLQYPASQTRPIYPGAGETSQPHRSRAGMIAGIMAGAALLCSVCGIGGYILIPKYTDATAFASATQTAQARPTSTPAETILYSDPLINSPQNWPEDKTCFGKTDGYHVMGGDACWGPDNVDTTDADIRVNVIAVKIATDIGYGIMFRHVGTGEFYTFEITPNGSWCFFKFLNSKGSTIVSCQFNGAIKKGTNILNTLRVLAVGTHFTFYVNDQQVGTADDSSITQGTVGVANDTGDTTSEVIFTNLLVARPTQ